MTGPLSDWLSIMATLPSGRRWRVELPGGRRGRGTIGSRSSDAATPRLRWSGGALVDVGQRGEHRAGQDADRDDQVQQRQREHPARVRQAKQQDRCDHQGEADRADDQQGRVAGGLRRSVELEEGIASHGGSP